MKRKNLIIIIGLIAFVALAMGISYSYFVYNKDVADVSISFGDMSIDLANINGSIYLNNVIPKTNEEGTTSTDYIDFTVNATVDTEPLYYEVYLLPNNGNTLNTTYLKTYLTNQSNQKISEIINYNNLSDSEQAGGKVLYKGLITVNDNGVTKNYSKQFRLRLWLDENYPDLATKTFEFGIYLYTYNIQDVNSTNISYGNDENCSTVECQLENIVGVY